MEALNGRLTQKAYYGKVPAWPYKKDSMNCCSFFVNGEQPGKLTADKCTRLTQLHEGITQWPMKKIIATCTKIWFINGVDKCKLTTVQRLKS